MKTKRRPRVVIYKATSGRGKGRWRARVKARNGKVLVVAAEGYRNRNDLVEALRLAAVMITREL